MADIIVFIAAVAWLVLAVVQANVIAKWSKKFNELYDELREQDAIVVRCENCVYSREPNDTEKVGLCDDALICTNVFASGSFCTARAPEFYCALGQLKGGEGDG